MRQFVFCIAKKNKWIAENVSHNSDERYMSAGVLSVGSNPDGSIFILEIVVTLIGVNANTEWGYDSSGWGKSSSFYITLLVKWDHVWLSARGRQIETAIGC